jgi:hypothetical protein
MMRSVAAGRLVNVYPSDNWVLGFLYRTSAIQLSVSGIQAVEGVAGVENFDVGWLIDGQMRYAQSVQQTLTLSWIETFRLSIEVFLVDTCA